MVKTRFAPSPTGHLHVGGARTALFSYYYAKRHGGVFVLRIEDTDFARSKKEYEDEILKSLKWLGVNWDEGPYKQSERQEQYRAAAQKLLSTGNAYKCYLTAEELEKMRAEAQSKTGQPRIRSPWRDRKPGPSEEGKPFAIRFRYPESGQTVVRDGILGDVTFENSEGDDLIVLRSDGTPTYQLSVVVDDLDMKITNVIRGDDHLNNTPKQLLMMKALGGIPPQYAHCPMILGPDKAKLSKRHGAVSVYMYAEEGYLPEALRNALIRLGWSHGDQELFSDQEIQQMFSLEACGKSPSVFDVQKLNWINGEFLKQKTPQQFVDFIKQSIGLDLGLMIESEGSKKLLEAVQRSAHKAKDLPFLLSWYLNDVTVDPICQEKILKETSCEWIASVVSEFEKQPWNPEGAVEIFKKVASQYSLKMPQVAKAVRVLLTGNLQSPDMAIVVAALGKEKVLKRLRQFTG
jgi:glutamyl-tRNA synthetase